MRFQKHSIFIFCLLFCITFQAGLAFANLKPRPAQPTASTVKTSFDLSDFQEILQQYQQSSGVKMAFKKRAYFPLLRKTKTSSGEIFLSGKNILLSLEDHLKTHILFDGQKWRHLVTPPGEKQKVTVIQIDQNISVLFQPETFFQKFEFISQKIKGRTYILDFSPKNKKSPLSLLSVQVENNRILEVKMHWQDSGNEETFAFSNIQFNQKMAPSVFKPNGF